MNVISINPWSFHISFMVVTFSILIINFLPILSAGLSYMKFFIIQNYHIDHFIINYRYLVYYLEYIITETAEFMKHAVL